jgi:hypothetical protein
MPKTVYVLLTESTNFTWVWSVYKTREGAEKGIQEAIESGEYESREDFRICESEVN